MRLDRDRARTRTRDIDLVALRSGRGGESSVEKCQITIRDAMNRQVAGSAPVSAVEVLQHGCHGLG